MLKIAVCDDVGEICAELENIILDFQKQSGVELSVDIFFSGEGLINYIKNGNNFDLIFLDIELGKINGVEVGHFIRDKMEDYITKIVYISSKNGYDRQLLDVQPLHFLTKPLDKNMVVNDIRLAIKIIGIENNTFSFNIGSETETVPFKDIIYFECSGRQMKLISFNNVFCFYGTISSVLSNIPKDIFMVPHRSYIVNYDHVKSINRSEIKMCNGDIIPISRLKLKEIKDFHAMYEEERYK
ncbi:MAG TPA: DNA-binding response regulator [Clostridiales bacterium]|nr:DNA-binding response regulator [Clostridiales bacterium]